METVFLHLRWARKFVLFVLMLSVAGVFNVYAQDEPDPDPYLLYLLFNDYQACEEKVPLREWNGIDDIRCQQLPKNEASMQASWYYHNYEDRTAGFLSCAAR